MSSVFLSHNHRDKDFVRRLGKDLVKRDIRVWIDEAEILIGDSLLEKVEAAIDEMDYLGVVLSPSSIDSEWVNREVRIALEREICSRQVKVLPILLKDCVMPGFLRDKLYADFRDETRYDDAVDDLVRSVLRRSAHAVDSRNHPLPAKTKPGLSRESDSFRIGEQILAVALVVLFAAGYWQVNHVLHLLFKQTAAETPVDAYVGLALLIALSVSMAPLYAFARDRAVFMIVGLFVLPFIAGVAIGEWRGRHSISAMGFFFMQSVIASFLVLTGSLRGQLRKFQDAERALLREKAQAVWLASLIGAVLVVACGSLMLIGLYLSPESVFTWPIHPKERQLLAILFGLATATAHSGHGGH